MGLVVFTAVSVAFADHAAAQRIYRWTDENGVVHFGNQPPANTHAEEKRLPPPPPPPPTKPPESTPTAGDSESAEPAAEPQTSSDIIFGDIETALVEGSVQRFSGTVKNSGTTVARNVSVDIRVTSDGGNEECVRQRTAVAPRDLAPGASGRYLVDVESPCFLGATNAELQTRWN